MLYKVIKKQAFCLANALRKPSCCLHHAAIIDWILLGSGCLVMNTEFTIQDYYSRQETWFWKRLGDSVSKAKHQLFVRNILALRRALWYTPIPVFRGHLTLASQPGAPPQCERCEGRRELNVVRAQSKGVPNKPPSSSLPGTVLPSQGIQPCWAQSPCVCVPFFIARFIVYNISFWTSCFHFSLCFYFLFPWLTGSLMLVKLRLLASCFF